MLRGVIFTLMLEIVYEGTAGKVKCEKCSCWLGFQASQHLITAPCPTCATPLVVPPEVLSFPEVKSAASIDIVPQKRAAVSLPSFPDRGGSSSVLPIPQDEVIRLVEPSKQAEVVEQFKSFPSRANLPQVSLPASRQVVQNPQLGSQPEPQLGEAVPEPVASVATASLPRARNGSFKARLNASPNDGLNDGVEGHEKNGFLNQMQTMTGFLSILAVFMIAGVVAILLFEKEPEGQAEQIEVTMPTEKDRLGEGIAHNGSVNTP